MKTKDSLITQTTLYLLREELKARRFFSGLRKVGLDDCYFQPHLDLLIMSNLGLDDKSDEVFAAYDNIVERRSRRIRADNASVTMEALATFAELVRLGNRLARTAPDANADGPSASPGAKVSGKRTPL